MPEIPKFRTDRFKLITAFLVVGLISLVQPGCDCSSSGFDTSPSAITSVAPSANSDTALVTADVSVLFRDEMDSASVENGFTLTENNTPVSASVSYDAATKTLTLTPDNDLISNTQYFAAIVAGVKDINGAFPLNTDYIWSFATSTEMQLVSKNADGVTGDNTSIAADIDATGRYIVFESKASNLTPIATTSNRSHIYRKDTVTGEVILVSSDSSNQVEADNHASNPAISADGRYVVFESKATNLDENIQVFPNGPSQVYRKDLENGSIELVSRSALLAPDNSTEGATNADISDDGRYIVFQSKDVDLSPTPGNTSTQIYRKDMNDESVEMISRTVTDVAGDAASANPEMSADGTHIVFESLATNFGAASNFNHIYYVDTSAVTHSIELISVATDGTTESNAHNNSPSISDDGLWVSFHTKADTLDSSPGNIGLDDVYLRFRGIPASTRLISARASATSSNGIASGNGASSNARITGDANYVVFESEASDLASGSTSGVKNILVRDLSVVLPEIKIEKVDNPSSSFASSQPAISADGRYIAFDSRASYTTDDGDNLSDIFRAFNTTTTPP